MLIIFPFVVLGSKLGTEVYSSLYHILGSTFAALNLGKEIPQLYYPQLFLWVVHVERKQNNCSKS